MLKIIMLNPRLNHVLTPAGPTGNDGNKQIANIYYYMHNQSGPSQYNYVIGIINIIIKS